MGKIELIENVEQKEAKLISFPNIDGPNAKKLKDYLNEEEGEAVTNSVFKNALQSIHFFSNPKYDEEYTNLSKLIAIGRVQSGKTSFFIASIALAFDNGYDICYLIGGTKNTLRDQNYDRVAKYFTNNPEIKVYDVNKVDHNTVLNQISLGHKVVLVILKNAAERTNLGKAKLIADNCFTIPSIVVDDEGDEYTPGAPKLAMRTGRIGATHDSISNIIYSLKSCTFLSVTATPQANLLISTIDAVSPDYAVLVNPGESYTGGNSFHDTMSNPHVIDILDSDDFISSVPQSFKDSLYFFIFAASLKRSFGDNAPYSMLVHPSSLTKIQTAVTEKIREQIKTIVDILDDVHNPAYQDILDKVIACQNEYVIMNELYSFKYDINKIKKCIPDVISEIDTFEFNISSSGKDDIERERNNKKLYKIYVGGNMLGRGLTIKNLAVTYIYRDSKVQAVDTLYQRARWLGYKRAYFDICRVYMTEALKSKFVTVVEHENELWSSLTNFLSLNINIKKFPRIFELSDETMILTRKTVTKTIRFERVNPGYTYDKTIQFTREAKDSNRELFEKYYSNHQKDGYFKSYSTDGYQTHFVIETKLTDFINEFIFNYSYPRGSDFGTLGFKKIVEQVRTGELEDKIYVLVMRPKSKEFRSPTAGGLAIGELPQGSNAGTNYDGDKYLKEFVDKTTMQIHLVYTDKNNPDDYLIMLAFNNPLSKKSILYVTGDNTYDTI